MQDMTGRKQPQTWDMFGKSTEKSRWNPPPEITNWSGWWLSHPSEKYEFVSWGYYSHMEK